jgi:hypothetical protein
MVYHGFRLIGQVRDTGDVHQIAPPVGIFD